MGVLVDIVGQLGQTHLFVAALVGLVCGITGGALPGISASITMALMLPFTFTMSPESAVVLLGSAYIGAEYGGSIPAILIRTPGTNAAIATAIDGYEFQKRGRGAEALGLSLMSGVLGGLVGFVVLVSLAQPLAKVALLFTAPAYFGLGVLGLSVISSLSPGSTVKGLMAASMGLMVATIGTDPVSGVQRFSFGNPELMAGIKPVILLIGLFAVSEIMTKLRSEVWPRASYNMRVKLPALLTMWRCRVALLLGTSIGTFEGLMPGAGGSIASLMSYNEARRWSKKPEEFGNGSPEGIAAPESSNNVVAYTSLVPTLAFGIPGSNSTAVLMGALLIHGLTPGPLLFTTNPDFITSLYAGLGIATLALLPLGMLILIPVLWLVNSPKPWVLAGVFALILSGVYTINHNLFDIGLVLAAGTFGYILKVIKVPLLPLVLGLILGGMVESNFRRSLLISNGDPMIFLTDPISLAFLSLTVLIVGLAIYSERKRKRREAQQSAE